MSRGSINSYYQTALDLHQSGKIKEARKLYNEILRARPNHLQSLIMVGQTYYQEQKFEEAHTYFAKGLELKPTDQNLSLYKGRSLVKLKKYEEAKKVFDELLETHPQSEAVLFHAARNYSMIGKIDEAISCYKQAIQVNPNQKEALNNLANLYQRIHAYEKANECYDKLIKLDNQLPEAYCNKAGLMQKTGKNSEAISLYKKTLSLNKSYALAYYNLGIIASLQHDYQNANELVKQALHYDRSNPKYLSTYAFIQYEMGNKKDARVVLQNIVQSGIEIEEPYIKLVRIFIKENELSKALDILIPLIERYPSFYEAMFITGLLLDFVYRPDEAIPLLEKLKNHPTLALKVNMILQISYSKAGRLDKYGEALENVSNLLNQYLRSPNNEEDIPVYSLAYYPFDQELVKGVMKKYSLHLSEKVNPLKERLNFSYQPKSGRLKIGYLSPNLRLHPDAMLAKDLFKYHDRKVFEVFAYSLNSQKDEVSSEIRSNVEHFTELDNLSVTDIAKKINDDGINILICLSGYNFGMKMEVPALKPAPLQAICCMGFNESLQSDFFDYAFGDEVVLSESNRPFFSEAIAYLPPSYFLNSEMVSDTPKKSKKEYGLPESSFVFGCLNHPRKISPMIFDAWLDILAKVPDSVLWLYIGNVKSVSDNLKRRAEENGVDPARVIFCDKEHYKEHYQRLRHIDLFLDTSIYNGHTTGLEALWMDVPLLTLKGETVSSRMCSSFLHSLNMEDMICHDYSEYVCKAVEFALNLELRNTVVERFTVERKENDFFNPSVLTRNMEKSYLRMWKKYEAGETPSDIVIS